MKRFKLTDRRRSLLERILREQGVDATLPSRIPRRKKSDFVELSFAQQRLWFFDQLMPGSSVYNEIYVLRLKMDINVNVLRRSLNEVIRRHEILRTTFREVGGGPCQVIAPSLAIDLPVVDLASLPQGERDVEVRRTTSGEVRRPFDLGTGPLLRCTMIKLGRRDYILSLTMHHIITDAWSTRIFVRELFAIYRAFSSGRPSPLPELPIQYADYAVWQRKWLQGDILEKQLSYWKERLAGIPPVLSLPTDRPRPAAETFRGHRRRFTFERKISDAINDLSGAENVTNFMLILAAFKALLYRYTGQTDIVVGTGIAGRNRAELEALIGFFVNTLVMRTDLSGNPTFRELVHRVRDIALGAYAHQDLPFERLVEELQPVRSLSHSPLFQVALFFQRYMVPGVSIDSGDTDIEIERGTSKFDCILFIKDTGTDIGGAFEYNTDLFDDSTIARFSRHLGIFLERAAADPDQRISDIQFMTAEERHTLLSQWNETVVRYRASRLVHRMFEAQAERTPDAIAIVTGDEHVTYGALNARSNRLARYLSSLGVGPEALVGICVERSLDMAVGILGVLKAGGAYVPLDPSYPEERIAFMLKDSGSRVLLTQQRFTGAARPPAGRGSLLESISGHVPRTVSLDSLPDEVETYGDGNPDIEMNEGNLVYLMYTSGSTGAPKGVAMPHGALGNLLLWQVGRWKGTAARTLQFAPLSFDVSFQEMFATWASGGTLVVVPEAVRRDPGMLMRLMRDERIERAFFPFVALGQLAESGCGPDDLPVSLAEVITAGEQLQVTDRLADLFAKLGGCTLQNQYGPAECHVVTFHGLGGETGDWPPLPPIGRPIANARIYILDRNLEPVPVGVRGELYIGGAPLARGYHVRPEASAASFVPDPFGAPGGRLYRTGDAARFLPGGEIEFLGRVDDQVKIRGYRVEPAEVEAVLGRHPAVSEAVVVPRADEGGGTTLAAYVVLKGTAVVPAHGLRDYLADVVPEYMIPRDFVVLDGLPLTPSGKVDRRSLPAPQRTRTEEAGAYEPPRSDIERSLAGIWCEVLGIEEVGIRDNFFRLGGHSLLATKVVSRVRRVFGVEVPLRGIFEGPTVADLAASVEAALRAGGGLETAPITRVPRDGDLPLSFAQQRLWFLDQFEPGSAVYNLPAAYRLKGPLDGYALEWSLNEIIRRHEVLRTTFETVDGRARQVIAPELRLTLQRGDISALSEAEREAKAFELASREAQQPFDLSRGPLIRASLLRMQDEDHVFLLNMHHIISDGWSSGVFIREIGHLYDARLSEREPSLPELPVQYADFASWQRGWLAGAVLEAQLVYWRRTLAGCPAILKLPTDRPRPVVQGYRGGVEMLMLPEQLCREVRERCVQEDVTLFMLLLAAFKALLAVYAGQDDIVVGTPIAGRNREEIENLIGFFVNTLVIRSDLSGDPDFRTVLATVKEAALGAYAHQDLPFEKLVDELAPERDTSHTPLFQVLFALQNASGRAMDLRGCSVSPMGFATGTAKFDLSLLMKDTGSGIAGWFEYNSDLFDAETIRRMAVHFARLIERVTADPAVRLSELCVMSDEELRRLLVDWNDTSTSYPGEATVHGLFEGQVERSPGTIAVTCEGQEITYDLLNRRANQLAHYLAGAGIKPESLVGILVERSIDMIVALIGVLKAGGAYLPIDTDCPPHRIEFMLRDAGAAVLLTQEQLAGKLPAGHGVRTVLLDRDWEEISREGVENPDAAVGSGNLAYVMYTSGSTGVPKAISIPHRAVNRLVVDTNYIRIDPSYRIAQVANCSFDAATFEVWGALLNGARLVIIPRDVTLSPHAFAEYIREHSISAMFLTAVLFNQIARQVPAAFEVMSDLIVGGEPLDPFWIRRVLASGPPSRLLNGYGPTEGTTFTACHLIDHVPEEAVSVPIGRPISNTRTYILDRHLRPVPVNVPGELYIGGDGLARDYLNRPELTAGSYLPDPFGGSPGARIYRSGDLCRYLPDGTIEFLGRVDHQVKIRGFRIEPGEVETVLREHPDVQDAVVVAREDRPAERRLVAYVVAGRGTPPTVSVLRRYLGDRLPDYMVPSQFVFLGELPVSPNRKVDRDALPAPEAVRPRLEKAFEAPRTPVERELAAIWARTLGVETVGINDNFFELGGDSIMSIQIAARANQAGIRFSTRDIFKYQTVADLAQVAGTAPVVSVDQGPVTGPVPLTPIQCWFFEQDLPEPHHFNQAYLFSVPRTLDAGILRAVVQSLQTHHDALRLRFERTGGTWRQYGGDAGGEVHVERIDLSGRTPAERMLLFEEAAASVQAGLNLSEGPLMRVVFFDLGPEKGGRLLIVIHHLAVDAVSWRILLEDLDILYERHLRGGQPALPPKTTAYRRWAERLGELARSPGQKEELGYWLSRPWKSVAALPLDVPGGSNRVADARTVTVSLEPDETRSLLRDVPASYNTSIDDILLTALVRAVHVWTGIPHLLIDLEGHGRLPLFDDVDVSRTVGWFTVLYPVCLVLPPGAGYGESVKSIKEQLRGVPNRGIGYGLLRYLCEDEGTRSTLAGLPRAELSFNYTGQIDQVLKGSTLLTPAPEPAAPNASPKGDRRYALEINGAVRGGRLQLTWTYSEGLHHRPTIQGLAARYIEELGSLIDHCLSEEAGGYTPSDFPEVQLTQEQLDRALAEIDRGKGES